MEIPLPTLLESNPGIAAIVGVMAMVGMATRILKGLFDFHYDYFTRRYLRRVTGLLTLVEPASQHHKFLQQVIAGEVFKIASGVDAVDRKVEILMHLRQSGLVRTSQMKRMARFIEPSTHGQAEIRIGKVDWVLIGYSLVSSTLIFLYGGVSFIRLAWMSEPIAWVGGSTLFLTSALVARFLSGDYRVYRALVRLKEDLAEKPILARAPMDLTSQEPAPPPLSPANTQQSFVGVLP